MPKIELIITMEENGQVLVTGPLQNKPLCYGLLEMGKDIVRQFQAPQASPLSVVRQPLAKNGELG